MSWVCVPGRIFGWSWPVGWMKADRVRACRAGLTGRVAGPAGRVLGRPEAAVGVVAGVPQAQVDLVI